MSRTLLRPATRDDLHALWQAFAEIVASGETYVQDAATTQAEFVTYWWGRGGEQWVAESEGQVAGGYTLRENHPGRGAHVGTASFVVSRDARGQGIGRLLGEHAIRRAREVGYAALQWNFVVATNTAAIRLWESLGFRVLARLPGVFDHAKLGRTDALVMFLDLHRAAPEPAVSMARVHQAIMQGFVDRGHAPNVDEIAARLGASPAEVEVSLLALHESHGVVLHPGSSAIWIAHPFSASPTAVWVRAGERGWWAPCLWCAMGIVALAAPDATVHARLGGEDEEVRIELRDGRLVSEDLVVHFAIPARDAWSNVVHWCATVLPFRQASDARAWSARHALPHGSTAPLQKVLELGKVWYGRHLDASFRKWTLAEAQQIFERVGLTGETWALPAGERTF